MSISRRNEIDLREKIADELLAEIEKHTQFTGLQAIGFIRASIWHGAYCPCSKCQRFEIKSCSDVCDNNRKITDDEAKRLTESLAHYNNTLFYCGYCNSGQNEYDDMSVMLFDKENEFPVTPCCHTEATEALKCYCPEDRCEADDNSQARDERLDYLWSQGAR